MTEGVYSDSARRAPTRPDRSSSGFRTCSTTDDRWWSIWRDTGGALILYVDLAPDADREARAFGLLDDEEKQRWGHFLVEPARRRFALCRAALRINLSERLGCSNRRLSFGCLRHGKPFAKVDDTRAPIGFNVSHSGRHGLIALGEDDSVGVDVEERVPQHDLDGIATRVYGPTERRTLATAEGRRKVDLFFRLWSMKEALIKALGYGFSLNPSSFEVPGSILQGVRSSVFRFPHAPSSTWQLLDLGESRFAAAVAYGLPAPQSGRPDRPLSRP